MLEMQRLLAVEATLPPEQRRLTRAGVQCAIDGATRGEAACRVDPTLVASHAASEELLRAWREAGRPAYEAFRRRCELSVRRGK